MYISLKLSWNYLIVYVTALYDFDAAKEGDLTIRAGDVITLVTKLDSDWWTGELNGETGDFPASYVEEGGDAAVSPKEDLSEAGSGSKHASVEVEGPAYMEGVCLYEYVSEEATDLCIYVGEHLWLQDLGQENWLHATNDSGASGTVPSNYVQLI
jgi:hypothetical protein